jgi:hypothetical protein
MWESLIMRTRVLLLAGTPLLAFATALGGLLAGPASVAADSMAPFEATVSETFTAAPCGGWDRCITAVGQGQATHLGAVTERAFVVVDANPADAQNGCAPETRTTVLTAANGDTITMSGTGWSCAATSDAHDSYTITGGTGRYQGASGSGSESNVHTFTGPGVGVATVTYDGDISTVGSLGA